MEARDFAFWLQGYLEISGASELDQQHVQIIKDHLKLVFDKKTPTYPTSGSITLSGPAEALGQVGYVGGTGYIRDMPIGGTAIC